MKTAVVTGASKGIGLAISDKLIQEGWNVIGIARTFPDSLPKRFTPYPIDLEDGNKLPCALKNLVKEYPNIDALVCNAGRGVFGSLEEFSFEDIYSLINLNFLSQAYLVKSYLPFFKKRQKGDIVFMGSEAALQGKKSGSIYCASKFALRGFAQALREECVSSNIRISLINPGMVESEFFKDLHFSPGEEAQEHILPSDVAEAVSLVLNARAGTIFDEINLSPQRKKIVFLKKNILTCSQK